MCNKRVIFLLVIWTFNKNIYLRWNRKYAILYQFPLIISYFWLHWRIIDNIVINKIFYTSYIYFLQNNHLLYFLVSSEQKVLLQIFRKMNGFWYIFKMFKNAFLFKRRSSNKPFSITCKMWNFGFWRLWHPFVVWRKRFSFFSTFSMENSIVYKWPICCNKKKFLANLS